MKKFLNMKKLLTKGSVIIFLAMMVSLIAQSAKAVPSIDRILIPPNSGTPSYFINSQDHSDNFFRIAGQPAGDISIFYNDGRTPNPVTISNAGLSFLIDTVSSNSSSLTGTPSSDFRSIDYVSNNGGMGVISITSVIFNNGDPTLTVHLSGNLLSLSMEIINPTLGLFEVSCIFTVTGGELAQDFGNNGGLAMIGLTWTLSADFSSTFFATVNTMFFPEGYGTCDAGKPKILEMRYTGEDCDASSNAQDPKKVSCVGDPFFDSLVHIVATDTEDPDDPRAKLWFEGDVILGTTFNIDATNAGENKLKANTWVNIYVGPGRSDLLQTIQFNTLCSSQPLNLGDIFGSLELVGFTPED